MSSLPVLIRFSFLYFRFRCQSLLRRGWDTRLIQKLRCALARGAGRVELAKFFQPFWLAASRSPSPWPSPSGRGRMLRRPRKLHRHFVAYLAGSSVGTAFRGSSEVSSIVARFHFVDFRARFAGGLRSFSLGGARSTL